MGRKKYLILGSENGGHWGSVMYTLQVSARLRGWTICLLNDVLSRIATFPYKQRAALLPQNWKPADQ